MKLNELVRPRNSKKRRKRIGRGVGSGHGKTSTRGHKGLLARSGGTLRPGFEGGQIPLIRRIPKRGFNNTQFKKIYQIVSLNRLNIFKENDEVTPEILKKSGIIKNDLPVKILDNGKLEKNLSIKAHAFSKNALESIKKIGGKATVLK